MKRFIFASHHYLAYGLKDTVDFLTGNTKKIYAINAYVDDEKEDLEEQIKKLFTSFAKDDEVIVLTDLMGGSVYQKFYPYISTNVHVLCGMNLPLAMNLLLVPEDTPFTAQKITQIVEDCKKQLIYVNDLCLEAKMDCDDE